MNAAPSKAIRRLTIPALLAAIVVLFFGAAAFAAAPPDPNQAASQLRQERLYVADGATQIDQAQVKAALKDADTPIYIMMLPAMSTTDQRKFIVEAGRATGSRGIYAAVAERHIEATASNKSILPRGKTANQIASESAQGNNNMTEDLVSFIHNVDKARGKGPAGVGTYVFLGILVFIVAGVIGLVFFARKRRKEREAAQMAELKGNVQEDVTRLGEDIARLDLNVADPSLAAETRDDYTRAMDSYDASKAAVENARRPADMQNVTKALEDGRYYMTAVRARLQGLPAPERRAPCFFNPQHGPSVRDVMWAPMNGAPRNVPACEADAERVERGEDPDARMVSVNGHRTPYWNAGPAYGPYAGGYYSGFGGGDMLGGILIGTALGSMFSGGWGGHGGYDAGYASGVDAGQDSGGDWGFGGGGDGGGFGGDWGGGGGDFGGDFGGGDW